MSSVCAANNTSPGAGGAAGAEAEDGAEPEDSEVGGDAEPAALGRAGAGSDAPLAPATSALGSGAPHPQTPASASPPTKRHPIAISLPLLGPDARTVHTRASCAPHRASKRGGTGVGQDRPKRRRPPHRRR